MSYILDALKKMEHEKTRKAGPTGMTNISGDLFREGHSRPVRGGMGKLIAVAVVASLVAGAATWFFLAPSRKPANVVLPAPRSTERMLAHPPVPVVTSSVTPRAAALPAMQPAQSLPQPALPPVSPRDIQNQPDQASQQLVDNSVNFSGYRESAGQRKNRKRPAMPSVAEQSASATMEAPPADISVAGIAWQEERRARRAVVNGFLLKEGSVVSGARISEIRKDRVRFSQAGRNFEVAMTAPGASGNSAPAPGSAPSPGAPPAK